MELVQFSKLIEDYLQPSVLGKTMLATIKAAVDPDTRAQALVPLITDNQAYTHFLQKIDILQSRINEWNSDEAKTVNKDRVILERIFTLLGKQASKNTVACVRLNRMMGVAPRKESERMALNPKEQLKLAIAAEDFCIDQKLAYSGMAYLGGFHYDWLTGLMNKNKLPKDAITYVTEVWNNSFKTARIAYDLSRQLKSFKYDHYVFPAALTMNIGKVFMSIAHPKELDGKSWAIFMQEMDKFGEKKPEAMALFEKKKFPFTHNEYSAVFVSWFQILSPVEKAIYHYQDPYYLKNLDIDLYRLAAILSISSTLATVPMISGNEYLMLNKAQRTWLKELKINETDVLDITKKVWKSQR